MFWLAGLASLSWGTTFPPAPPLGEQLARAELAGVYVVRSTQTVTLEDGFVATRAEIEAVGEPVRGEVRHATLGVPGGMLGERYVESVEGAPRISEGDELFLFLQRHADRYILAGGFVAGLYRKVETSRGPVMVDGAGMPVTSVSCEETPERKPGDEAMSWEAAVAAFSACGGQR